MQEQIITLYCVCTDFLKEYGYHDDPQAHMSTAEVMTTVLVTATFFVGNQEHSRIFLQVHGYIPKMLSKSRLNRRLHRLPDTLWEALWHLLAEIAKHHNPDGEYIVDSCPVPVCDNIRISRCKLYQEEAFRGRVASKRRYIYGLKVHLVVTASGQPIENMLAPASVADIRAFRCLPLDLPEGCEVYAEAAYTDYHYEDDLRDHAELTLSAARKRNSKRPVPGWEAYVCQHVRKRGGNDVQSAQQAFCQVHPCGDAAWV